MIDKANSVMCGSHHTLHVFYRVPIIIMVNGIQQEIIIIEITTDQSMTHMIDIIEIGMLK